MKVNSHRNDTDTRDVVSGRGLRWRGFTIRGESVELMLRKKGDDPLLVRDIVT